jgi:hypothetical protein
VVYASISAEIAALATYYISSICKSDQSVLQKRRHIIGRIISIGREKVARKVPGTMTLSRCELRDVLLYILLG